MARIASFVMSVILVLAVAGCGPGGGGGQAQPDGPAGTLAPAATIDY